MRPTVADWYAGARPRTLAAAVAPVLTGTALAAHDGSAVPWKAGLALVVALGLQVGVNYANDYADGIGGVDRVRAGPRRLVAAGIATPRAVRAAAWLAFAVAAAAGLALAAATAWWLVGVGALAIAAAWRYACGARPYGHRGLGEVMVFVFFGLVAVIGTAWVQTLRWNGAAVPAAVGIGALASAMLVANNLRDRVSDGAAGKMTLAVRLGDRRTRRLYVGLVVLAALAVVALASATTWTVLAGLGFLAVLRMPMTRLRAGATGSDLVGVLHATAAAEMLWAVLVGVALVAGARQP